MAFQITESSVYICCVFSFLIGVTPKIVEGYQGITSENTDKMPGKHLQQDCTIV